MIPIPDTEKRLLEKSSANYSLLSPRLVEWTKNRRGEFAADTEMMAKLCKRSSTSFSSCGKLLENVQKKQDSYISSLSDSGVVVFRITATTTSPFITGLGSGHPTETGMVLDRNTGLPYIPASSIKGVLRLACAINLAESNPEYRQKGEVPDDDETLVKYFGSMSQEQNKQSRGQLVFLDAYPEKVPSLKVDIMNPHFGKYYSGENKQPVETESPVPIKFLAVKENTTFIFRCAFIPLGNSTCDVSKVKKMFKKAFEEIGFGGKTSIGYGRFKELN